MLRRTAGRFPSRSCQVVLATPGGGKLPEATKGHSGAAQEVGQGPAVQEEAQGMGGNYHTIWK